MIELLGWGGLYLVLVTSNIEAVVQDVYGEPVTRNIVVEQVVLKTRDHGDFLLGEKL